MTKKHLIQLFEERKIRAIWDNVSTKCKILN